MHTLYLVKVSYSEAQDSKEARNEVLNELEENGFISQGYFGAGKADWFVVGGRWSGFLAGKNDGKRDNYNQTGEEDDAILIDSEEKVEELKKIFVDGYKDVEVFDIEECEETDISNVLNNYSNPYWLVVVDYHS